MFSSDDISVSERSIYHLQLKMMLLKPCDFSEPAFLQVRKNFASPKHT